MSNKTTAILTFLVSTVIPFIQEVVDFIDMFRTGKYNREGSASLKAISLAMQDTTTHITRFKIFEPRNSMVTKVPERSSA